MMTRYTDAEVIVVGLVGEPGRALKQEQSAEDARVQREIDDRVRVKSGG